MKIYAVGIHLNERVFHHYLGHTSYVICFVQAPSELIAKEKAKEYYESKYRIIAERVTAWIAREQNPNEYIEPNFLIK